MNWGNRLLVTFIVFGAGMIYLVYRSLHTDYQLVEKDYYNQELKYQEVIDGMARTSGLHSPVVLAQDEQGVLLTLPDEMKNKTISGRVWFYCAYDISKDRKLRFSTSDARQVFIPGTLMPGQYLARITWNDGQTAYISEKNLVVH